MERLEARLLELLDKQEIHERLALYCRGVDRADPELISQAFHPDAMADHGHVFFTGEDIAETLMQMSKARTSDAGVHLLGNVLIEIDGDDAYSEAYFLDYSERDRQGEVFLLSRCARYIDRWEKRSDAWRITYRRVVDSWNRIDPVLERWPGADKFLLAKGGRDDAIYDVRTAEKIRPPGAVDGRALIERMRGAGFSVRDADVEPGTDG
jgi:hypothetical protein